MGAIRHAWECCRTHRRPVCRPSRDSRCRNRSNRASSSDDGNVVRGGACGYPADVVRTIIRYVGGSLTYSNGDRGFRIAVASSSTPMKMAGITATNTINMEFAPIPSGSFTMGSPENEDGRGFGNREPQVSVTLSKNFWMGKFEVTQKQWKAVMSGRNPSFELGDDLPVNGIGHRNATDFCTTLTYAEHNAGKLSNDWTYRLPTDAEWKYACRAGTTTRFSFGDDASIAGDYAWYLLNSGQSFHTIGLKKPNKWGLYDMHGNVWEWCYDDSVSDVYSKRSGITVDPSVEEDGSLSGREPRVLRGGS
jgi:formylglycine-generating enzyme required for sulfatase activity